MTSWSCSRGSRWRADGWRTNRDHDFTKARLRRFLRPSGRIRCCNILRMTRRPLMRRNAGPSSRRAWSTTRCRARVPTPRTTWHRDPFHQNVSAIARCSPKVTIVPVESWFGMWSRAVWPNGWELKDGAAIDRPSSNFITRMMRWEIRW